KRGRWAGREAGPAAPTSGEGAAGRCGEKAAERRGEGGGAAGEGPAAPRRRGRRAGPDRVPPVGLEPTLVTLLGGLPLPLGYEGPTIIPAGADRRDRRWRRRSPALSAASPARRRGPDSRPLTLANGCGPGNVRRPGRSRSGSPAEQAAGQRNWRLKVGTANRW